MQGLGKGAGKQAGKTCGKQEQQEMMRDIEKLVQQGNEPAQTQLLL